MFEGGEAGTHTDTNTHIHTYTTKYGGFAQQWHGMALSSATEFILHRPHASFYELSLQIKQVQDIFYYYLRSTFKNAIEFILEKSLYLTFILKYYNLKI